MKVNEKVAECRSRSNYTFYTNFFESLRNAALKLSLQTLKK